jgi:hypothetical protein
MERSRWEASDTDGEPEGRSSRVRSKSNAYNHAALVIAFVVLDFIIRFLRRSLDLGGLVSSDFVLANLRGNQ